MCEARISREDMIAYFLCRTPSLTKTQLMKLCYFADLEHIERYGEVLSDATYKRDHYGVVDYAIPDTAGVMAGVQHIVGYNSFGTIEHDYRPTEKLIDPEDRFSISAQAVMNWVVDTLAGKTATELGRMSKQTKPWKYAIENKSKDIDLAVCKNDKRQEYLKAIRERIDRSTIGTSDEIAERDKHLRDEMERYQVACS